MDLRNWACITAGSSCSHIPGCEKAVRKIVLQLKMIEWGVFGLGESTAGMFLAYHHKFLGPYFGNLNGHNWPHEPLSKEPSLLEKRFHQQLVKIAKEMSNGKLTNVSMLDLPAFGSKIAHLDKKHQIEANWPTELNFIILNDKIGNKGIYYGFNFWSNTLHSCIVVAVHRQLLSNYDGH